MEPKTASPPEAFAGEHHFCKDSLYWLSPFKLACRCWLPSRSIFGERTRAYISRASHHSRRHLITHSEASRTHKLVEHKNTSTSGGCSSPCTVLHQPKRQSTTTHWSRVLHHHGGSNQYKSRVFLCYEFVEFVREILAS